MNCLLRSLVSFLAWLESKLKLQRYADIHRTALLRRKLAKSHPGLQIQHPIRVEHPEHVEIGRHVSIAAFVHIWGGGGVRIGDRVLIGSHSAITSETHDYSATDMSRTNVLKPVVIEDDVWIGTHCTVLPGITVGRGAVVGAGAVVTKDVAPMSIVAGVPAKSIGQRLPNQ
jgi:maltose O-acetyltransferase